jgi:hypothetical protein
MSLFDDARATKKESSCSLSARKVAWLLQDEPRHPHVTFPIDRFLLRQQRANDSGVTSVVSMNFVHGER